MLTRRYTRQIVEGVEYLHHCKVIHRDIKGSNIMCDTSGNIKLADFGSAKQICSVSYITKLERTIITNALCGGS